MSQPVTHVPEHLYHLYDQYVAAGLRANSAVRNAYPLFTGKNDPKMSDKCPLTGGMRRMMREATDYGFRATRKPKSLRLSLGDPPRRCDERQGSLA